MNIEIMMNNIRQEINQLSDISLQRKLWLNENNDTGFISSYVEVMCTLFDDNNFDSFIDVEAAKRGISPDLISELSKLRDLLNNYQEKANDSEIIMDPKWMKVVNQAKIVLEKWEFNKGLSALRTEPEILAMLVPQLISGVEKLSLINTKPVYYNELFGDTSFLLTGLLELMLKKKFDDWEEDKWFDDSLLSSARFSNSTLTLGGVIIWGREDTSQRWTDPFSFQIDLRVDEKNYKRYAFLFGHVNDQEVTYEEFIDDHGYWDNREKDWKYIIHSDNLEEK
jgi:hypothetical protein